MKHIIPNNVRINRRMRTGLLLLGVGLVFSIISGCSSNMAVIETDNAIDRMFTSSQLPDSYTYYYIGSEHRPYAILGLMPGYTLTNTQWWDSLGTDEKAAAGLVDGIRSYYWWETVLGGAIKEPSGKQIGIFYSGVPSAWVEVTPETREVYVIMQDPWNVTEPGDEDASPREASPRERVLVN